MNVRSGTFLFVTDLAWLSPWSALLRYAVATAVAILAMVAMWFNVRRCSGGLTQPISMMPLLLVALLLAGLALAWRWLWCRSDVTGSDVTDRRFTALIYSLGPILVLLLVAGSVSLPGTSHSALLLLWGVLVAEEGLAHWCLYGYLSGRTSRYNWLFEMGVRQKHSRVSSQTARIGQVEASDQGPSDAVADFSDNGGLPADVWQQITRARDEDGHDIFYGRLRGDFAVGQRSMSLHVAFCPPLTRVPQLVCERIQGPDVTVQPVQVLPYGARLDIKRKELGAGGETVIIEFCTINESEKTGGTIRAE